MWCLFVIFEEVFDCVNKELGYFSNGTLNVHKNHHFPIISKLHPDGSFTTAPCTKLIQGEQYEKII